MNYTYHQKSILRIPLKPIKISFTKKELKALFTQKEVQEALFLSSPNLLNEFNKWQKEEINDKKEEERLIYSLLKYANRMHNRCTPFGLFAGCSVIDGIPDNVVIDTQKIKRSTRLDMNFTCALAQELAKMSFIRSHLKYYPNTSIYKLQNKIRYVEYYYKNKKRVHQISAVNSSIYLQKILDKAQNGSTIEQLALTIIEEDINIEDALDFVTQIIDSQLLVSEIEPAVTGEELLNSILTVLLKIQNTFPNQKLQKIIILLKDTQTQLSKIDNNIGNDIKIYEVLAKKISQLDIPFELSKLFQTDLFIDSLSSKKNESSTIQTQLTKTIKVLNQFTSKPTKTYLTEFQKKFYERYEDKEILLLEALDIETGIGYAEKTNHTGGINPLVNDLILSYKFSDESEIKWDYKQAFLFKKLLAAQKNKQFTVSLTTKELGDFEENWEDLPHSFSIMYNHLGQREGKNLLKLKNVGGSSATYLLGRFASSNPEISELVTEIANTEQQNNPNIIYAEIAHLPESRTGNILIRPAFRKYEIPYLSNSTLPKEQQITLDDLYLSIKHDQLILRSKKMNKQIIPRLGNAHNYSYNALPVYHFLCDLQTQNIRPGLSFDWGNLKQEFPFLPRIEIENVVISSATWQLEKKHYEQLLKKQVALSEELLKWQQKWLIPDLILLAEGDNELLINLKDELSVKMFFSIIKKKSSVILKEYLFDKNTAIVKDEKGEVYTNEFIAILEKKQSLEKLLHKKNREEKLFFSPVIEEKIIRTFSIGSEWLYYKVYCGVKISDTILTEVIKPLTSYLLKEKLIDSWFFIRYSDPDIHLRIRFHITDTRHIGRVISLFQNAITEYEKNGLIWKIQTDTYQREIERYGNDTMILGEQIFYYDSKCIVDMVDMIDGDEGEEIRWMFAIRAIDELFSDFNYSYEEKRDLLEILKTNFAYEFNMSKKLKMQIDKKFREYRIVISDLLNNKDDKISEFESLFELLKQKSLNIKPIVNQILTMNKSDKLPLSLDDLLASYIHMLMNRLFKNKQRLHEMVVYDFMWRTYRSELAKQKQLKKTIG